MLGPFIVIFFILATIEHQRCSLRIDDCSEARFGAVAATCGVAHLIFYAWAIHLVYEKCRAAPVPVLVAVAVSPMPMPIEEKKELNLNQSRVAPPPAHR